MEKDAGVAVTISRQTGSGGTYVGYLAAKMLGFRYVDREILQKAAQEMGTDVRELELQDERSSGLIETILKGFAIGAPFSGMMRHARPIYDRDLFASERKIVQDIAGKYNAVFIGRAAFHMLRDHRGFSCLRLCPSGIPDRPYHEGTEDFHVPGGVVHPGIGQETGEVYS